jgi:hypothetical protein
MKRMTVALAALVCSAGTASAQGILSTAKAKAQKAVAASNAQKASPKAPASQSAKATSAATKGKAAPSAPADSVKKDTLQPPPTIYREMFTYEPDGRRDPFLSLLTTNDLRPTMSDLRLTGVLFDHSGRGNSLATLRDITNNTQYRVGVGSVLGRMRVSEIRTGTVVFTIDELGTTRRDSLVLRDSTNKARIR